MNKSLLLFTVATSVAISSVMASPVSHLDPADVITEATVVETPDALSASIQKMVSKAAPVMVSPELVSAMQANPELELTAMQQQAIEKIMLDNAQSLQIILDGFRANLETLVEKIKYDIYPVLSPRQQAVMKKMEAVQAAELDLLKAKMELDMVLKHKTP
jgi:Spy/CpxP family protein refolding chaperone